MPNGLSVELYIPKQDVLRLLSDDVSHILVRGFVEITSEATCTWNVEATGFPVVNLLPGKVCPMPCSSSDGSKD